MGSPRVVTSGQQYNVREKPTVILYTYINYRHAEPPNITKNMKNNSSHRTTDSFYIDIEKRILNRVFDCRLN